MPRALHCPAPSLNRSIDMRYSSFTQRIGGRGRPRLGNPSPRRASQAPGRGRDHPLDRRSDFDTPDLDQAGGRRGARCRRHALHRHPRRPALREAIAALSPRTSGQAITAENVAAVSGAQGGLFVSSMLVLDQGDDVVVPEPMYLTYEATFRAAGANPHPRADAAGE